MMSFPPGTEMFQFPGFASTPYEFRCRYPCGWVSPFGNPRINDCSHLPAAYRSVPRPSSPLGAKASTERSYRAHHDHTDPHAGPSPTRISAQPKQNAQLLLHSLARPVPIRLSRSRSPDRSRRIVTNHSDSPVKQHRHPAQPLLRAFAGRRNLPCRGTRAPSREWHPPLDPRGKNQHQAHIPWRRSVSNRRPPACKAGALPLSYAPESPKRHTACRGSAAARWLRQRPAYRPLRGISPQAEKWWAREDLNLRPHAYQACALTN